VVFGSPADRCDGVVSLVGEFNNWGNDGDFNLTQDPVDPDIWTGTIALTNDMNLHNDPDIIEVKFRLNADWPLTGELLIFHQALVCRTARISLYPLASTPRWMNIYHF
jgi:hypothetical protein